MTWCKFACLQYPPRLLGRGRHTVGYVLPAGRIRWSRCGSGCGRWPRRASASAIADCVLLQAKAGRLVESGSTACT